MNEYKPVLKTITIKCVYCGRERTIKTLHEEEESEVNRTCQVDSMPMIEKSKVKIIWKEFSVN